MTNSNRSIRFLFLNGDLPVFPGWAGHEYLNVTCLTKFAEIGLVSQIHSSEQQEKTKKLIEAGIHLYAWENPAMFAGSLSVSHSAPPVWRKRGREFFGFLWSVLTGKPADTYVQRLALRNMAGALIKALNEQHWDALIIIQSSRADWIDTLPKFPWTMLVFHDVPHAGVRTPGENRPPPYG